MIIGTDYIALLDLFYHPAELCTAPYETRNIGRLVSTNVIELEYQKIILATIYTRMRFQIVKHVFRVASDVLRLTARRDWYSSRPAISLVFTRLFTVHSSHAGDGVHVVGGEVHAVMDETIWICGVASEAKPTQAGGLQRIST